MKATKPMRAPKRDAHQNLATEISGLKRIERFEIGSPFDRSVGAYQPGVSLDLPATRNDNT